MDGAGHGSTVLGPQNTYWHFASMALSYNVNWERRLCMFPLFFDDDGLMWTDASYGDYPHFAPSEPGKKGEFAGWMLLSFKKPVKVSSFVEDHTAQKLTDENAKTFWLAKSNDNRQWVEIDLLNPCMVRSIQINYFDYQSDLYGRIDGLRHRYKVEGSLDGKTWQTLIDKSNSYRDAPNDYEELAIPQQVRYVRYKHIEAPTPHLAISDIRIFGTSDGEKPHKVSGFKVERKVDRRDALLTWKAQENVQGYTIRWGIAPDKLYNSWLVYDDNELMMRSLTKDQQYYFTIEAFNENGISEGNTPLHVK